MVNEDIIDFINILDPRDTFIIFFRRLMILEYRKYIRSYMPYNYYEMSWCSLRPIYTPGSFIHVYVMLHEDLQKLIVEQGLRFENFYSKYN